METEAWSDLDEPTRDRLRAKFKGFVETAPLYQKHELEHLPSAFSQIQPEVLLLHCPVCRREQPFRPPSAPARLRWRRKGSGPPGAYASTSAHQAKSTR